MRFEIFAFLQMARLLPVSQVPKQLICIVSQFLHAGNWLNPFLLAGLKMKTAVCTEVQAFQKILCCAY